MTMKLLCSFAIIAGCGYIGLVVASEYEAGVVQIREFINALKYLETEISINSSVLSEASRRVSEVENGVVSDIFLELSDGMTGAPGERVDEIWMRAVDNNKKRLCLNRETIDVIKEFSVCLGSGTPQNGIRQYQSCMSEIEAG